MCGLLAFVSAYGAAHQHEAGRDALESIHHRGPDGTGSNWSART